MPYWSTSGLDIKEQVSYWGDVICEAFTPLTPRRGPAQVDRSATPEGVPGWVRSESLVHTNVAEIASCTQLLTHGPAEVRRAPLDAFFVNLQIAGTCYGEQDDRRCVIGPGSFAVFDTTRPYKLEFHEPPQQDSWRVLSFRVPQDQWEAAAGNGAVARAIDTDAGPGRIVGTMMNTVWAERPTLDLETLRRIENAFSDVLTAVTSTNQGQGAPSGNERSDAAVRRVVRHYVREAIPLGRVTAEAAARQASVSVRTLHRAFQVAGTTFADCVRDERLLGATSDLKIAPSHVTLSEIAARWGFCDSSHLTRTFQRNLGCTPSQFRETNRSG